MGMLRPSVPTVPVPVVITDTLRGRQIAPPLLRSGTALELALLLFLQRLIRPPQPLLLLLLISLLPDYHLLIPPRLLFLLAFLISALVVTSPTLCPTSVLFTVYLFFVWWKPGSLILMFLLSLHFFLPTINFFTRLAPPLQNHMEVALGLSTKNRLLSLFSILFLPPSLPLSFFVSL